MILQAGAKIGGYTIDDFIGRGEMGEVYRARDVRLDRFAVLKVLSDEIASNGPQFARFQREARTGALLNHPNIAAVYAVGTDHGLPFVVSEWLHGTTLRARLSYGALSPGAAIRYTRQIARGLAAAHEVGVAHRCIKPENIFITAEDRVKILDFGMAKCWTEALEVLQADERRTRQLEPVLGNICYLSPEQVRGEEADDRSDIFSLGVVLYEMLSGRVPFRGHSPIDTMSAILHQEMPPLDTSQRPVGRELDRIVHRCLEKDPSDRFQSARDVEFNLETGEPPRGGGNYPFPPTTMRMRADAGASAYLRT